MLFNKQWYLKQRVPLLCTLRIAQAKPLIATYTPQTRGQPRPASFLSR